MQCLWDNGRVAALRSFGETGKKRNKRILGSPAAKLPLPPAVHAALRNPVGWSTDDVSRVFPNHSDRVQAKVFQILGSYMLY